MTRSLTTLANVSVNRGSWQANVSFWDCRFRFKNSWCYVSNSEKDTFKSKPSSRWILLIFIREEIFSFVLLVCGHLYKLAAREHTHMLRGQWRSRERQDCDQDSRDLVDKPNWINVKDTYRIHEGSAPWLANEWTRSSSHQVLVKIKLVVFV